MAGRSTSTNLALITQEVAESMDGGGQMDVIYTDFSRAFDTIDHSVLLTKLSYFGFSNSLVQLMRSYLLDRVNYVYYNGFMSRKYISTSGVPQGSNLGPLLFNIFINDLITSLNCSVLAYADDLKIYHAVTDYSDVQYLQRSIDYIADWCSHNKLQLNVKKCCVVSYTKRSNRVEFDYSINESLIARRSTVKDLGVLFDEKLSFGEHVTATTLSAFKSLGFIFRTSKDFDNVNAIKSLFFSMVVSKLEYGAVIWYPIYDIYINQVERIQRKFLKFLSYKMDGIYPARGIEYRALLDRHGFESLSDRRDTISSSFIINLANGKVDSPELLSRVNFCVPGCATRSTSTFVSAIPRTNVLLKAPLHHSTRNANSVKFDIFR